MADTKELKPKSFRIDDETAEKFKQISSSIGGNQQETLSKLIEAYEFQSGKAILTDKKAEIDQFEKYVNSLVRMFMGSLEDNQNITETVRTEFEALLRSKDNTIQDLQAQLVTAKQNERIASERSKEYAGENIDLRSTLDNLTSEYNTKIKDLQNSLIDKDNLNKALTDSVNESKSKIETMAADVQQAEALKKELSELKQAHDKLIAASDKLQADLSNFKAKHEEILAENKKHENEAIKRITEQSQIDHDKSILELEKKHQEEITALKTENQSEIAKYQQKYLELLEQIASQKAAEK